MFQDLLVESIIAGVMLTVIGIAIHYITVQVFKQPHDLNDMKVYGVHLLLSGFVLHLVSEWSGINKWYCKNGVSCRNPQTAPQVAAPVPISLLPRGMVLPMNRPMNPVPMSAMK
jgi:hypothetical protein